jgi:CubicO group peptidase (beta-lactamase class C family)
MTGDDLAELLGECVVAHHVPGAAVGLLRDDECTVACAGTAHATTGKPVTAESRFGAGSLTKSMVATVVAQLAAGGRLSLADRVALHVPELRGAAWAEEATIEDLLANRSGLPLRAALEFDFGADEDSGDRALATLVSRIAAEAPTHAAWSYTNAGWCVLGRVLETVTGRGWEDAMRAILLAPAGMRETAFTAGHGVSDRVSGHLVTPDGPIATEPLVARAFGPAGTSLVSTAPDMLRFAALHLGDPALALMRCLQPSPRIHAWLDGWCLGWGCFDWAGGRVWGWDSVLPGERAFLRLLPEPRAAVVLLTNGETGRALYRSLFAALMPALLGIETAPLLLEAEAGAAGDLTRFAGIYGSPGRRIAVRPAEGSLRITTTSGDAEAIPLAERTFVVDRTDPDTPTVTFDAFDIAGRPQVLYDMIWALPRLDS